MHGLALSTDSGTAVDAFDRATQCYLEYRTDDSALKAEREGDVRLMLERVAGRHPVVPARRIGYAAAAARYAH